MSGMSTTHSGWSTKNATTKNVYGTSSGSLDADLVALDNIFDEIDDTLTGYNEVSNLNYTKQRTTIDTIADQGDGLIGYAAEINDTLLENVNDPYNADLSNIVAALSAIDYTKIVPYDVRSGIIDVDYGAIFSNGSYADDFKQALELKALQYEIDRLVREGFATVDDPNDLDELLAMEKTLNPELLAILAGVSGPQKSDIEKLLIAYFEKQVRILLFEHKAIHDYVKNEVAAREGGKTEVSIKHGGRKPDGSTYGFMDVYKSSTGEVWEIKPIRQAEAGRKQVQRYVEAGKHQDNKEKFPNKVKAGTNVVPFTLQLGNYTIEVTSGGSGVVLYKYKGNKDNSSSNEGSQGIPAVPKDDDQDDNKSDPKGKIIDIPPMDDKDIAIAAILLLCFGLVIVPAYALWAFIISPALEQAIQAQEYKKDLVDTEAPYIS